MENNLPYEKRPWESPWKRFCRTRKDHGNLHGDETTLFHGLSHGLLIGNPPIDRTVDFRPWSHDVAGMAMASAVMRQACSRLLGGGGQYGCAERPASRFHISRLPHICKCQVQQRRQGGRDSEAPAQPSVHEAPQRQRSLDSEADRPDIHP